MKTLIAYWLLALAFLRPGVEGEEGGEGAGTEGEGAGEGEAGSEGEGDGTELDLEGAGEGDGAGKKAPGPDTAAELAAERQRAQRLETELADIRARQNQGLSQADRQRAEEDRILADPKADANEKWRIQANREIRGSREFSQNALAQAQDLADKTAFGQLAVTKPAIHKRYAERVETELTRMRQTGQSAPREAILRFLIGADAMNGKLAPKKSAGTVVDRGKSPGARSDVTAKGRQTEQQKRASRLENVII